jgi:hypothetical protein
MKKSLIITFYLTFFSINGFSQNQLSSKIVFVKPDTTAWKLINDDFLKEKMRGALVFKHKPIIDSKGRQIEPIIALVYESVNEKIDVIEYSINVLANKPYKINRNLLGGFPDFSSDKHSVVFKGDYIREGVKHEVYLGYILFNKIGIEIIGDGTEDIFSKVEIDIKKFVKSVYIKD